MGEVYGCPIFSLPFKDRTLLLAYPYAIKGNKLYQVFDNDETGEWELHVTGF